MERYSSFREVMDIKDLNSSTWFYKQRKTSKKDFKKVKNLSMIEET
jgi:hypothetical protein